MKVGDLVKLNPIDYPQQKGELGVLVSVSPPHPGPRTRTTARSRSARFWAVMIAGKIHPYTIAEEDMEVINASQR